MEQAQPILGHFRTGDKIHLIVQAFCGEGGKIHQQQFPLDMTVPYIVPSTVIASPKHRSPNEYENMGEKMWYFTSDLPVTVAKRIDATMHIETPSDMREVFHLDGEHWASWHEKNRTYWSILTIFGEGVGVA